MEKFNVNFPKLGIRITPDTDPKELDRLAAKHPKVKEYLIKHNYGKGKPTKDAA